MKPQKYFSLIGLLFFCLTSGYSQTLSFAEQKYLDKHACEIKVDSSYQQGNWKPVLKQVKNKKIVLLGEYSHGAKEIFVLRNDLIKSLHEKAGFNVVLFEAGIGELAIVDLRRTELSPRQMTYGFFGIWVTEEFEDLMRYIKTNDLSVAGFDVQKSGRNFIRLLMRESRKFGIGPRYYRELEIRFDQIYRQLTNSKTQLDSIQGPTLKLIRDYQILDSLLVNRQHLKADKAFLLIRKTLANRISFLNYSLDFVKNKDWHKRWEARDLAMASNIEWLIDHFYKDEKIIVVGHNYHFSKFNEKEEVMGEFLKSRFGTEMYVLATYAGKGVYFNNSGKVEVMAPPDTEKLDIKHVIKTQKGRANFLNIPDVPKKEYQWLFDKIIANDTFIDLESTNELILSKHFDGLLLIDKVSPPIWLNK